MANSASSVRDDLSHAAKMAHDFWAWVLLRGLLAIALGVVTIMWPLSALFAFTLLFAAFAFADGVISLLLGVAIFIIVFPNPTATILSAAWLIAIYAFVAGIVLVVQAFRLKRLRDKLSG